ncbi:uncharacterized protein [Macrobrachium rosenbergii]|uniref:uncharacterized protein n=1 Tax=Macrobrachium rosenbergii TaxID=79674 RepID=UPI0034D41ECD
MKWSGCPSKQNAADTMNRNIPRGSALHLRQESLSHSTSGTPRVFAPPSPSSGMPDSQSLPVPLESPEQCQALSISDVEPPIALTSVPGPDSVPMPAPNCVMDPPTGDPPNLTELIIANCEPPAPADSSSQSPSSVEDEPLADLNTTPSLVDQELSSWDAEAFPTLTTVVAAAKVGSISPAPGATSESAPDSTSGLSPESVPSSPSRNGVARPWWNLKKKKGRKRSN